MALRDASLPPPVRARAAQALVDVGTPREAVELAKQSPDVVRALIPLLWEDARIVETMQVPTIRQIRAKDALFELRSAGVDTDSIDGYLADWLTGYYDERASFGVHQGEEIIRAIGPRAAPKLIAAARETLAVRAEGDKFVPVRQNVLRALALTGAPEAVAFLVDLTEEKTNDWSLPTRAMAALSDAPPAALVRVLPRLQTIAASATAPLANVNVAFELIEATGKDNCLKPFVELAAHEQPMRTWMAAYHALACAGPAAIQPIAEAIPSDRALDPVAISHYFWDKIVALGPESLVIARRLLDSPSWVARLTGLSVIDRLGSVEDASRVRMLAGDTTPVRGQGRTLGQEAKAVVERLEKRR